MVPRETVSFVFPRVLMFPKHQDSKENKTNQFPEGPDVKCFVVYLDFSVSNRSKTSGAGNNCGIVSRSGYI